ALGQPRLACQFLLCPIMDYAAESDSRRSLAQGYLIDRATLEHDLRHYLGPEADRADPRVSPLRAPGVMNLPPTVIHTAAFDARQRIARSSDGKPSASAAAGISQIRPWLRILVKTFRLSGYELRSLTIEGTRAAAHWRVDIHSKITGAMVATELVDLIEVRDG